jgi:hypothetical protein
LLGDGVLNKEIVTEVWPIPHVQSLNELLRVPQRLDAVVPAFAVSFEDNDPNPGMALQDVGVGYFQDFEPEVSR